MGVGEISYFKEKLIWCSSLSARLKQIISDVISVKEYSSVLQSMILYLLFLWHMSVFFCNAPPPGLILKSPSLEMDTW